MFGQTLHLLWIRKLLIQSATLTKSLQNSFEIEFYAVSRHISMHLAKVQASFYGFDRNLPRFSQTCPKNISKKWPPKKALHVNSGAISCQLGQFGCHYFQIKAGWAPFLLWFSGSVWRFSEILPRF